MLKKNMRKRLLAGALATIMALTMCPTWALAVDEGTTLPAPEGQMPVVDSTPTGDTIQTPDAGTQGQTEPKDTEQAGQLENQDTEQAPSGGTDIEETGNNSSSNENDSQNNDAVSNSPANTISVQEIQSDRAWYQPKAAKYFVLLPKRGTPKDNADQGQANYLPSSDDKAAGTKGSDGGVDGLSASTGYRGYVTVEGMKALANTSTNSITDIENGVDEAYLEKPEDLGFFTPGNWNDDGTVYNKDTNTDPDARNALLNPTNFTFNPNKVTIVWYTIKDQSWGYGWNRVEDIHVDGYLKGIPVNVTYYPNYTTNGISGKNEDPIVDNKTSGDTYTIRGSNTFTAPEGYSFGGWYTEAACTNEFSDTTTVLMSDLYLYAKWIPNPYTVTWKNEGTTLGTEKVVYNHKPTQSYTPTKEADNAYTYTFKGWAVNGDTSNIVESTDIAVTADVTYVAVFEKTARQKNYNYTINKHFYNEKGAEVNVAKGATTSAVENTEIKDLYTANKQETVDGKTYVYVPGLTKVTDNLEKLTKDVTIDLYYYLDVKGGEKPDETGNGTPDAWEYRLAFKVVNGEWNNGGSADIVVYVPFKDYKTGKTLEYVVVPITRIPVVGDKPNSGYRAGSWDTTPVGNAKVEKDTVFTYTYAKKSSSGGGGGGGSHKPTVTIPDDVPTGLNGDDHYAYIVGYPDSTVRPQNGITRAEVATIFFRLLTDETRNANSTKSNSYSDVAAGAWYNHAVSTLSAMGIVKGDSQGKFNPNAPITRAEFAAIAARFDDKANTTAVDFSDIASHWAKDEISAAANNGWINGYTDGTFRPNNKITRAEAMTLVNRVLKRLPETAEDLHNDMIKWSDNSDTSAWYYLAVQEATNSHYYDIKENKYEKWSKLRETRDWTELEK